MPVSEEGKWKFLDKHVGLRQKTNLFYKNLFKDINGVEVFKEPNENYESNHWLSCITIENDSDFSKADFQSAMSEANIETRPLWKPMHLQPVFKDLPYFGNNESETLFNKGLCLPSGSNLTDDDRDRIFNVVSKFK